MSTRSAPVQLPELAGAAPLDYVEAVTIVREIALRVARDELPGVPSAHVIRVSPCGSISVEGPIAAGGSAVRRAAQLLESLLPGFGGRGRVPGALRLIVARAAGTLDLPPYPSLESFADALSRFAAVDPAECFRQIVANRQFDLRDAMSVDTLAGPRDLGITISDIRRARRATRMPLNELSRRCGVPVHLLRELEWGYFDNWPGSHVGRRLIVGYAKAAGLDERLVTETVWPLLVQSVRSRGALALDEPPALPIVVDAAVEHARPIQSLSTSLARIEPIVPPRRWNARRVIAALTIPALIAIGAAPALLERSASRRHHADQPGAGAPAAPQPVTRTEVTTTAAQPAAATQAGKAAAPASEAHPARLSDAPAYSPAFANEGSAMFYHVEANGRTKLMRADLDRRGDVLRITSVVGDRGKNFHARPSPDGKRIAFDSDRDGTRGVYVADANGRNVRRISGEGFAAVPSWSPDGRRLAFVRGEPGKPKVWNLWVLDLASGQSRRLTSYTYGQPWGGSWFPDGRRLAYSHEDELVILDLAKGTRRVFPSPVKGRLVRTPAVSPDGSRVVFQVYHRGTWLLDLRNTKMRKVLGDPTAEEYAWSPDGRRVAYHSRGAGNWGIWLLDKVGVKIVNTEQ